MPYSGIAEREFNKLTEDQQGTIVSLMIILNEKNSTKETETKSTKPKKRDFPFDIFKDGHEYMADDFDDIPEGFEDYV